MEKRRNLIIMNRKFLYMILIFSRYLVSSDSGSATKLPPAFRNETTKTRGSWSDLFKTSRSNIIFLHMKGVRHLNLEARTNHEKRLFQRVFQKCYQKDSAVQCTTEYQVHWYLPVDLNGEMGFFGWSLSEMLSLTFPTWNTDPKLPQTALKGKKSLLGFCCKDWCPNLPVLA